MYNGNLGRELVTLVPGVQYTKSLDFTSGGGATGTLQSLTAIFSTRGLPDGLEGVSMSTPITGSFSNGGLNATKVQRRTGEVSFRITGNVSDSIVSLSLTLNSGHGRNVGFWLEFSWVSTT